MFSNAAQNSSYSFILQTDLEPLQIRQRHLRCDRLFHASVDLETLHHIQLYFIGLRGDHIGSAPLLLRPQLVR